VSRLLSYSEIDTAQTCFARWDFAYGGTLAGSTLKPKGILPILSDGRAWGAAVAAWHQHGGELLASWYAHQALRDSLDEDAVLMTAAGFPPSAETRALAGERLGDTLDHYMATATPLTNLTRLEEEVVVPIPSRGGKRASSKYRFLAKIDGWTDDDGNSWLVEYKLRNGALTPAWMAQIGQQYRWYAWAFERVVGKKPVGLLLDERLNEAPKPARVVREKKRGSGVNGRTVSHAVDQMTTPERYIDACHEFGSEPEENVLIALRARVWQHRHPLQFSAAELTEAGLDLTSMAKVIRDLDRGELRPVRHSMKSICNGCKFKPICPDPSDHAHVESLYDRTIPKRLRPPKDETPATDQTETEELQPA
jgi:hypothetical protein